MVTAFVRAWRGRKPGQSEMMIAAATAAIHQNYIIQGDGWGIGSARRRTMELPLMRAAAIERQVAAVNAKGRAGDHPGRIREEENRRPHQIFWFT